MGKKKEEGPWFFSGHRRTMIVTDYQAKQNTESEKRIKIDFKMPLSPGNLRGAPQYIQEAFNSVAKLDNHQQAGALDMEIEGVEMKIFEPTDTRADNPSQALTGCVLRKLEVARPVGESLLFRRRGHMWRELPPDTQWWQIRKDEVFLTFNTTVPGSTKLAAWCYAHLGTEVGVELQQSQLELPNEPDDAEQLDIEDRPRRSGKDAAAGTDS